MKTVEIRRSGKEWVATDQECEIPPQPWGLYDTADHCWMGDALGPKVFSSDPADPDYPNHYAVARIAAQVLDARLRQHPGRTRVRTYGGGADKLRETVDTKMTAEEALSGLEDGRFI